MALVSFLLLAALLSSGPAAAQTWWLARGDRGPAVVLLPASPQQGRAAFERWRAAVNALDWTLLVPAVAEMLLPADAALHAVEAALEQARKQAEFDADRVYLVGEGASGAAVFYFASRRPDLWAAAVAIGGSPREAVQTGRLFAANTLHVPLLWLVPQGDPLVERLRARLQEAGYNLIAQQQAPVAERDLLDWVARYRRDPHPLRVDCETDQSAFGRCYWTEAVELDFNRRNDLLPSSRIVPPAIASLDLGGFGFDPAAPGPGILVSSLPPGYKGPLRLGDRIVALAGKPIADARAYLEFMEQQAQERPLAVMIQRGGERLRLETRIVLPRREQVRSARWQAEYLPGSSELLIISRGVAKLRLRLPARWGPLQVNWNGQQVGTLTQAGCWELDDGAGPRPCQAKAPNKALATDGT